MMASRRWNRSRRIRRSTWWSPTSTCRAWTDCPCWQKIQETEDKKSTVIVSAYGDMGNIRTAMNRGAFDFLTKPIDFADLEATIEKTIRHVEMLREVRRRQAEAERAHASLSRYFSPEIAQASRRGCRRQRRHGGEVARGRHDLHRHHRLHDTGRERGARACARRTLLNEYVGGMTDDRLRP